LIEPLAPWASIVNELLMTPVFLSNMTLEPLPTTAVVEVATLLTLRENSASEL
jgi:hypothetical protein